MRARSERAIAAASDLLARIGATHPDEIDVELVAAARDAHVLWLPLTHEDGHVRRRGDAAFIGVAQSARASKRWRFTIMHEVAHRLLHGPEGGGAFSCALVQGADGESDASPEEKRRLYKLEEEADDFAAEFLLAREFFADLLGRDPGAPVTIDEIGLIAECLDVSLSATALRYVELAGGDVACAVVLSQKGRIAWRSMSDAFGGKVIKGRPLDAGALAAVIATTEDVDRIDGEVRGAWGKRLGSVREQSIRAGDGALTWLWHAPTPSF